jgi:hypothetical protein
LLSQDDVTALARDSSKRVSRKRAHEFLKKMRVELDFTNPSRDLTDGTEFDWRGYIAAHPEGPRIVGPGVCAFEVALLGTNEPNAKFVPVEHCNRCDFIASRVDGTAVRMHPSSNREAMLVFGRKDDWQLAVVDGSWAVPENPAQTRIDDKAWQGFSQSDMLSHVELDKWVQSFCAAATVRPLHVDITGSFPWWLHVNAFPMGRKVAEEGIVKVELMEGPSSDAGAPIDHKKTVFLYTTRAGNVHKFSR